MKHLQRELVSYQEIRALCESPEYTIEADETNFCIWNVRIHQFDMDSRIGKEMANYEKLHGQGYVWLCIHFPRNYPMDPPFVYVRSPRLLGDYIHQGAICTDMLMKKGWTNNIGIEGLILQMRLLLSESNPRILNPQRNDIWSEQEARNGYTSISKIHADW